VEGEGEGVHQHGRVALIGGRPQDIVSAFTLTAY
jgi:hypothetical protein